MWSPLPSSSPDPHSSLVLVLSNHLFVEIHFLLARKSENILWTDWDPAPELWLNVRRIIYEICVPILGSSLVIRHFSEAPRLSLTLAPTILGWMIWVMRTWSWRWLIWISLLSPVLLLSRVCQISFGNLSHSDQHQLSHETQIFITDEWWLWRRNENDEIFSSRRMCVLIPPVWKLPSSWQTPGHLFPDPGNYTTLLPLRSQGSLDQSVSPGPVFLLPCH